MFFAPLTKNRERNMATPEETRDRIKAMRERIFNEPNKESFGNDVNETPKDNELAEKKSTSRRGVKIHPKKMILKIYLSRMSLLKRKLTLCGRMMRHLATLIQSNLLRRVFQKSYNKTMTE